MYKYFLLFALPALFGSAHITPEPSVRQNGQIVLRRFMSTKKVTKDIDAPKKSQTLKQKKMQICPPI